MPVRDLGPPEPTAEAAELLRRLIDEWRNPGEGPERPEILIDRQRAALRPLRIYVLWDAWDGLGQLERSELILNACEQVKGHDIAREVMSAMGLTHAESERLGVPKRMRA